MGRLSRNDWVILVAAALGAAATLIGAFLARCGHAESAPGPAPSRAPSALLGILPLAADAGAGETLHLTGWSSLRSQYHYLVVRTPQGDLWLQERKVSLGPDGAWSGTAQLGQVGLGQAEAYTVFLVASPRELRAEEVADHLPDGVTVSNEVTVVRRSDPDT
jgi:hypothetical protein